MLYWTNLIFSELITTKGSEARLDVTACNGHGKQGYQRPYP